MEEEKEQGKNLEGFIEGLYNIKIKPEYFGKDSMEQQLEEMGFIIKRGIKPINTYNIKLNIPDEITKSEKPNYIKEKEKKLNSLVEEGYAVYFEKSVEMKALDNDKTSHDDSNPV